MKSADGRKAPSKVAPEPPRGMRDLLPDEVELRDATAATILEVYRRYGFRRVETPALENLQLLTRGEGGENEKLIFKVLKRGEKLDVAKAASEDDLADLGLRFDLTVPLARYYAHNHARLPRPLKAVQIGPVWRAERPQKGRFRQFTQCDIDILGQSSWIAEVELILATTDALTALGMQGLTVRINDRRILVAIARRCGFEPSRYDSVFIALDKLDKIEWSGVAQELKGTGHPPAAIAKLQGLFADQDPGTPSDLRLKTLREHVSGDGQEGFDVLSMILRTLGREAGGGWRLAFDPTLVRGMSYYTGPIFEVATSEFSSSIAGGGRYDELIGKILGQDVPATGFSIGFERVILMLLERQGRTGGAPKRIALIFDEEKDDLPAVLASARMLRADGLSVSAEVRARKLGHQLAALSAQGFEGFAVFDGTPRPSIRWFSDQA